MAQAIVLREHGGPNVLKIEEVDVGQPGPGEIRVRQTAIGVNFHDVYVRTGSYKTLTLPGVPGIEAVGIVEAVGPDIARFRTGDRVAYVTGRYGAYASERLLSAELAVRLPPEVDDRVAATAFLKGLTAEMLVRQVYSVRAGDTVLVHAAAGGVGRILCQWANHLGATVIGTVGSPEKAELARAFGCRHTILYRQESFVDRVRDISGGRGIEAVYDSVGKDTFSGSLECLALRGHLVNFGQSSGAIDPFPVTALAARSTTLTRPMLFHYTVGHERLERMAAALFDVMKKGVVTVEAGKAFPLAHAAAAHEELESRGASGPLLLLP